MALYLGNKGKVKVILSGIVYYLNLYTAAPITNGVRLLSLDNYILKDSKGLYIIAKESE